MTSPLHLISAFASSSVSHTWPSDGVGTEIKQAAHGPVLSNKYVADTTSAVDVFWSSDSTAGFSTSPLAQKNFLSLIYRVQAELENPLTEKLDAMHFRKILRPAIFSLEGLYRLYAKRAPEFKQTWDEIEELEDTLGLYFLYHATIKQAKEIGLSVAVVDSLTEKFEASATELTELLNTKWRGEAGAQRFTQMRGFIESFSFLDAESEMAYVGQVIADEAQALKGKVVDFKDLEDGMHEYRRDVRWFSMYMMSLEGGVTLVDDSVPVPEYELLLDAPVSQTPFAKLNEENLVPEAIRLPRTLYLAINEDVRRLGELKDTGEFIEVMAPALVQNGEAKDLHEAEDKLVAQYGKPADFFARNARAAQGVYDRQRELGLFDAIYATFGAH